MLRLIIITLLAYIVVGNQYCTRSDQCWPSSKEIQALSDSLNPEMKRSLHWTQGSPRISAVPIYSPDDQPLYGSGDDLKPVYSSSLIDRTGACFQLNWSSEFCRISVRNTPYEGWMPGFVIWPLNSDHVQKAVQFAVQHNLCIMVAGTGHDFLNRHSCDDGFFIRTSLMKEVSWDLVDSRNFGHPDGNVRFGPGIVFSEAHKSAADNNRLISSGWATTVGIIGWSIGGGHGPFVPSLGLGVDNILEIQVVNSKGEILTANANENSQLFWAIRGGGGSTWGVITAITVRAHQIPTNGIMVAEASVTGNMCDDGLQAIGNIANSFLKNSLALNQKWGGLTFFVPEVSNETDCGAKWTVLFVQTYTGQESDPDYMKVITTIFSYPNTTESKSTNYKNWYEKLQNQDLQPIIPVSYMTPTKDYVGGVPSVLVSRESIENGQVGDYLLQTLIQCQSEKKCKRQEFYHITGNLGSPQDDSVAISQGLRKSLFHLVAGGVNVTELASLYQLGKNSYFSQSAYTKFDDWQQRYWGNNYERLQLIKSKYDPTQTFWCNYCI